MKRILTFTLAFALVAFVFSSCSKDKKENGELKTLEGTSWTATFEPEPGDPGEGTLNFAPSGNEFTLLSTRKKTNETMTMSGSYIFNAPNITLSIEDLIVPKAPTSKPKYTFHGVVNGKTLTVTVTNIAPEPMPIVFNMK